MAVFFNDYELKTSFLCPNKVKYDREKMFKLGKLLFKFKEFKIESSSVIKYFQIRLLKNCCFCGVNFGGNLSTIKHYFCGECLKRIQHKEFKCKICQVYHKCE